MVTQGFRLFSIQQVVSKVPVESVGKAPMTFNHRGPEVTLIISPHIHWPELVTWHMQLQEGGTCSPAAQLLLNTLLERGPARLPRTREPGVRERDTAAEPRVCGEEGRRE